MSASQRNGTPDTCKMPNCCRSASSNRLRKTPQVQEKVDKALSKQQIIYCHCGSGVRVLAANGILSKLGYDVRPLAAGYDDLVAAGFAPAKNQK